MNPSTGMKFTASALKLGYDSENRVSVLCARPRLAVPNYVQQGNWDAPTNGFYDRKLVFKLNLIL